MKKLRQYQKFDYRSFLKDKELSILKVSEAKDGGSIVKVAIQDDNTDYGTDKNGNPIVKGLNNGEIFSVHTSKPVKFDFIPGVTKAEVVNISRANVYGDYFNNLSIRGDVVINK